MKELKDMSLDELHVELFKRWDALGVHKDDDLGEVYEVMEALRAKLGFKPEPN